MLRTIAVIALCGLSTTGVFAQGATPRSDCLHVSSDRIGSPAEQRPIAKDVHVLDGKLARLGKSADERMVDCHSWARDLALQEVARRVGFTDILLLGEVHDNPWHHTLRANILRITQPLATIVFEHIRADQADALAPFNAGDLRSPARGGTAELFKALDWDNSGWPDKALFEPLYAAALTSGARLAHGDPPRALVREVARKGLSALPAEEIARLKLDRPFPIALQEALLVELEDSHCGLMPKTAFGNMASAQRYRDAYLAAEVLAANEAGGRVILLAGNGHVRDSGVPFALAQQRPSVTVDAIQFLEVEDDKTDPRDYATSGWLVFAPRAERKDPCVDMRARFRKKG